MKSKESLQSQLQNNLNGVYENIEDYSQRSKVLSSYLDKLNTYPTEVLEIYDYLNSCKQLPTYEELFIVFDKINKLLHNYEFNSKIEDTISDQTQTKETPNE